MSDYTFHDKKTLCSTYHRCSRDFTLKDAIAEIPGRMEKVPYIQRLVRHYREEGFPIIHIIRLYRADGSNVNLSRKRSIEEGKQIVILGSDGAELMDELKPSSNTRLDLALSISESLQ